jgi:hypothetical protein
MIPIEPTTDKPLPFDLSEEQPKTHKDAVAVAANTADLINQLGGGLEFDDADLHKAADLITTAQKTDTPPKITNPNEAAAASALIKRFDFQAFADIMQARTYITNKLLALSDCGDPRLEIRALELLGKHSDVGLFTDRSEITVHHTTSEGLEKSIKDRIKRLLNSDVIDVTPLDDLDTQLGSSVQKTTVSDSTEAVDNAEQEDEQDDE